MSDNEKTNQDDGARRSRGATVGLRAAALAGVVLSAGAWSVAAPADTQPAAPTETVASAWPWPMGSTCCPEEPE